MTNANIRFFALLAAAFLLIGCNQLGDNPIVGIWDHVNPYPTGWTREFRADGTFTFTSSNAHVEGSYTAKDGIWSQTAPQFNFNDTGTYRFLDKDRLELTGRLGKSVWARRKK